MLSACMALIEALATLAHVHNDAPSFQTVVGFCQNHWVVPIGFVVAYLALVYATRKPFSKRCFPGAVDNCFAAWNLGLSLFSCWGCWHMSQMLKRALSRAGLFYTVCGDTPGLMAFGEGNPATLALILFCLSKIPELGDTVFLILKCKPVRLLQWYHHSTVLLFCWLALATEYTPGIWFAVTNYFVHSIMYMYFFLMTFKSLHRLVRPIAPFITIIQIAQMVWGLVINALAIGTYFATGNCKIQGLTVYCAIAMYGSYFYLFSQLYLESRASSRKSGERVVRTVSRKVSQALLGDDDGDKPGSGSKKMN